MPIQTQDAILLKKRDLRETSLILTFLTRDCGKINGVIKGARGSRARSSIKPLFFSLDQIVFYEKKKEPFTVSQCENQKVFFNILSDWDRTIRAYYFLELVDRLTETGEACSGIFEAMLASLVALDNKNDFESVSRFFEVRLLLELGLWPGFEDLEISNGAKSTLKHFEQSPLSNAMKIRLTKDVSKEISKITKIILSDNLDRALKVERFLT